ncbi:MAG TPA: efflux RND transporter periplasmic adaptor subunit [Opitutaceae bacterium]|nr:efflux RND transporter periplasmic adaptor subunit [Opitutaceae bacterium]
MKLRLLFSGSLLGLLVGCAPSQKHPSELSSAASAPKKVALTTVAITSVPSISTIPGTVQAIERARLAAKVMGRIEEMPVVLGQRVKKGDTVIKLTSPDLDARLAQAKTSLEAARQDRDREQGLLAVGASTRDGVRTLDDRVRVLEAQVREAEAVHAFTLLHAPFDGVIARRPAQTGDLAMPGMVLLEVHGENAFEIESAIPEDLAEHLLAGSTFSVSVPSTGVSFNSSLTEMASAANAETRSVQIKASVPAGELVRGGQFVRLSLPGKPRPMILIPSSALARVGQMERVFTVTSDHRVRLRIVKSGDRTGNAVEILSGLAAGEKVVVSPLPDLRDGDLIESQP